MKRMLIIGSFAPSLHNFRGALLEELVERGLEIHAAAPNLSGNGDVSRWLENLGVVCHDLHMSRSGLNPVSDLFTLWQIVRLTQNLKPDVFFAYTVKPVVWGLLAARISRVPARVALITGLGYAFTGNGGGVRSLVRYIAKSLYSIALRHATLVFFQNTDDKDEFIDLGLLSTAVPSQVVAGSGVDIKYFSVAPFPQRPMRFLLIARLLGDKGIREYAEAAQKVLQIHPNVEFHLVGGIDPSPDGITEQEVLQWHDAGFIHWHGHVSDVRCAIAMAHVYVLPSYREGTPRTVLEAMSMGRPIITTNAPGCRETVINDKNGKLVPVKNPHALANAILQFIEFPELVASMGASSRCIAETKFEVGKVNSAMISAMGL
jgi:glycosyltransferase involved in cell wall biosynthesis